MASITHIFAFFRVNLKFMFLKSFLSVVSTFFVILHAKTLQAQSCQVLNLVICQKFTSCPPMYLKDYLLDVRTNAGMSEKKEQNTIALKKEVGRQLHALNQISE